MDLQILNGSCHEHELDCFIISNHVLSVEVDREVVGALRPVGHKELYQSCSQLRLLDLQILNGVCQEHELDFLTISNHVLSVEVDREIAGALSPVNNKGQYQGWSRLRPLDLQKVARYDLRGFYRVVKSRQSIDQTSSKIG